MSDEKAKPYPWEFEPEEGAPNPVRAAIFHGDYGRWYFFFRSDVVRIFRGSRLYKKTPDYTLALVDGEWELKPG